MEQVKTEKAEKQNRLARELRYACSNTRNASHFVAGSRNPTVT